jgi:hypothetical protein
MYLVVFLILAVVVGYLLAGSRLGRRVDKTTSSLTKTSQSWADAVESRWRALFSRRSRPEAFRDWALGDGSSQFTREFRDWLADLSAGESQEFCLALADYAKGLGFSLNELVDGGLDQDPFMRQVFVEAIVVYSNAYRKAKRAHQQAKVKKAEQEKSAVKKDGKKPAEKETSHRNENVVPEASETPTAA